MDDNTITPAEIAEFLRKTAAAFDAMPDTPIPGALISLEVGLCLHRYTGDHTTNEALMAFTDLIGTAAGTDPAVLDECVYKTPWGVNPVKFQVRAFLKPTTPVVTIDPAI